MFYEVEIRKNAIGEPARIDRKDGQRIATAIDKLAQNPRVAGCKKPRNRNGWRIRVGEYRILHSIEEEKFLVLVARVGHCREVYR